MKPFHTILFSILFASLIAAISLAQSPGETPKDDASQIVPKGDEKKGRLVFEVKYCHRCHTIEGEKFPEIDLPPIDHIALAGVDQKHWNRDTFAHHIMDPQHIISPQHQKAMTVIGDRIGAENSPMPSFTDLLTVRDLIDLATFLESAAAQ